MTNEFATQTLKPKQLTTIAVLCLIDGILNVAYGLIAFISIFIGNLFGILFSAYCLTLGVLEIRYAISLFSDPIKVIKPAQYIAIMQIINIITRNVFTLFLGSPIIGIVILILHRTTEVRNYFQWRQSLSLNPQGIITSNSESNVVITPAAPTSRVSILAIISFVTGLLAWIPIPIINAVFDIIAITTGRSAIHEVQSGNGLVKGKVLAQLGLALGGVNLVAVSCVFFGVILTKLFGVGSLAIAIIELVKSILDTINNFVPRFLPSPSTPTPTSWVTWVLG